MGGRYFGLWVAHLALFYVLLGCGAVKKHCLGRSGPVVLVGGWAYRGD